MTDDTEGQQASGGEAVAEVNTPAAPKSDAEAALQEAAKPQDPQKDPGPKPEPPAKKPNKTGEYIHRLQDDNRALRARLEELEKRLPPAPKPMAPDPQEFYTDPAAYTQRTADYAVQQAREQWEQQQRDQAAQQEQQRTWQAYTDRLNQYAEDKPDFYEVVSSIRVPLDPAVEAAIAAHESGPAIAYHLGLNPNDAFVLAQTRPELAAMAVELIASRMKAAHPAGDTPPPSAPAAPEAAQPSKPISQAPAPAPRVGGRSPTEVPPEKMTDDEWYAKDRERRRPR